MIYQEEKISTLFINQDENDEEPEKFEEEEFGEPEEFEGDDEEGV